MRGFAWGTALGLLALLGLAPGAQYGAKADSRDVLLAVPASAQPFVPVLTTDSPPLKKR